MRDGPAGPNTLLRRQQALTRCSFLLLFFPLFLGEGSCAMGQKALTRCSVDALTNSSGSAAGLSTSAEVCREKVKVSYACSLRPHTLVA